MVVTVNFNTFTIKRFCDLGSLSFLLKSLYTYILIHIFIFIFLFTSTVYECLYSLPTLYEWEDFSYFPICFPISLPYFIPPQAISYIKVIWNPRSFLYCFLYLLLPWEIRCYCDYCFFLFSLESFRTSSFIQFSEILLSCI